ncbi:MAG: ABC transporter permease [Lachnospiraceae bacterium]
MFELLKADFYRIKKGNLGYISAIVLFLFALLLGALAKGYSTKEIVESTLSSGGLFMPIMITNVLMIVWGHEFNNRTVNNVLISGTNRLNFFISKFVLTAILTGVYLMVYGIGAMASTLIFKGGIDFVYTMKILLAQIPLYLAISSLGVLLFNVINTTYVAIIIFLVASFIGDSIISTVVLTYLKQLDFLLDHLFVSNISNIAYISVLSTNDILTFVCSALIFSIVFGCISYQVLKRREFK